MRRRRRPCARRWTSHWLSRAERAGPAAANESGAGRGTYADAVCSTAWQLTVKSLIPACVLSLNLMLAPPAFAQPPICEGIESPGLLMGGGAEQPLCNWFGSAAVLVVNTASQCGFTPQFKGLESLYQQYKDRGLVVLGFPSDNFGGQEFAQAEKTAEVCYINYGVSFPMFRKIDVVQAPVHPLFQRLAEQSTAPQWNFSKYLISAAGVEYFGSRVTPQSEELVRAVERALAR